MCASVLLELSRPDPLPRWLTTSGSSRRAFLRRVPRRHGSRRFFGTHSASSTRLSTHLTTSYSSPSIVRTSDQTDNIVHLGNQSTRRVRLRHRRRRQHPHVASLLRLPRLDASTSAHPPPTVMLLIVQTDKTHIHKARSRSTCTAARRRRARVQISPSRSATLNLTIVVGICLSIVCPVQHASSSRPTRRTSMTYTRDRHTRRHADDEPRVHTSLRRCPPPSRSATLDPTNVVGVCLSPVCPVQHHARLVMQYTVGIIFRLTSASSFVFLGIIFRLTLASSFSASFFDLHHLSSSFGNLVPPSPSATSRRHHLRQHTPKQPTSSVASCTPAAPIPAVATLQPQFLRPSPLHTRASIIIAVAFAIPRGHHRYTQALCHSPRSSPLHTSPRTIAAPTSVHTRHCDSATGAVWSASPSTPPR